MHTSLWYFSKFISATFYFHTQNINSHFKAFNIISSSYQVLYIGVMCKHPFLFISLNSIINFYQSSDQKSLIKEKCASQQELNLFLSLTWKSQHQIHFLSKDTFSLMRLSIFKWVAINFSGKKDRKHAF